MRVVSPILRFAPILLILCFSSGSARAEAIPEWKTLQSENAAFRETVRQVRDAAAAAAKAGKLRDFEAEWYATMFDDAMDPHRLVKIEKRPRAELGADFDKLWAEFQKAREQFAPRLKPLFEQAVAAQKARVETLLRTAKDAAEIEADTRIVDEMVLWQYPDPGRTYVTVADEARNMQTVLKSLHAIFAAHARQDSAALATEINELRRIKSSGDTLRNAIDARVRQYDSVFARAVEEQEQAALILLRKNPSSAELRIALDRIVATEGAFDEQAPGKRFGPKSMRRTLEQWEIAKKMEESGDVVSARSRFAWLAKSSFPEEANGLALARLKLLGGNLEPPKAVKEVATDAVMRKILADIRDAQSADAALARIVAMQDGRLGQLKSEVHRIGDAWRDPRQSPMRQISKTSSYYENMPFVDSVIDALERANRHIAAVRIPDPDLESEPLAGKRLDDALAELERIYFTSGKWLHLHNLMKLRPQGAKSGDVDAIANYIAGQRMEAAADFRGAVGMYRKVIDTISEKIPHKEAAERLKSLRASHPEAFQE